MSKISHVFKHVMMNLRLEISSEGQDLAEKILCKIMGVVNFPAKVPPEKMTGGGEGAGWSDLGTWLRCPLFQKDVGLVTI